MSTFFALFATWILLSGNGADAFMTPRKASFTCTTTTTQLYDIVSNYQRRNAGSSSALKAPEIVINKSPPEPVVSVPEPPVISVPEPPVEAVISLPEPPVEAVISLPEPIITMPEPFTSSIPEPVAVVETIVKEVAKTPTDRAPTIFEFFRDNIGAIKQSAKTSGGSTKLLADPVSSDSLDIIANAKEKLAILKSNALQFSTFPTLPPSSSLMTDTINSKIAFPDMDGDMIKKSTDFGKAISGVAAAAGAAASTANFGSSLNNVMATFRLEEYGAWYVAGLAVVLALIQRKAGFEDARAEFSAQLNEANQKAAQAAEAANIAAEAANRASKIVVNGDKSVSMASSILESSKLRAIQVDKEMMQSALNKLTVETAALKKQLAAATQVKADMPAVAKPMEQFTAEMMEEMDDPDANNRILALIKQVDEENLAKKAGTEIPASDQAAAEAKDASDKAAAEAKAASDKAAAVAKAASDKAAVEAKAASDKAAAEAKAASDKAAVEAKAVVEAKAASDKAAAEAKAASDKAAAEAKAASDKAAVEAKAAAEAKAASDKAVAEAKAASDKAAAVAKAASDKAAVEAKAASDKAAVEAKAAAEAKAASDKKAAPEAKPTPTNSSAKEEVLEPEPMFFALNDSVAPAANGASKGAKTAEKKVAATKGAKKTHQNDNETDMNPWKTLSPSTLKRKTAKDLSVYLENRGAAAVGGDGKPLTKDELVALVQSL